MTIDDYAPSAAAVLRTFFHSRSRMAPKTVARDREAIGWLTSSMEAYAPTFLDADTSRRLESKTGGQSVLDVVDVTASSTASPSSSKRGCPFAWTRRRRNCARASRS